MVTPIGGLSGIQQQQSLQKTNDKLQATIAALVTGSRINKASDDVTALSISARLQSEISTVKQASVNLAQAASLSQVADDGIAQIQQALQELKSIAQQASGPAVSDANRAQLGQQFKQLTQEIDRIVGNTSFNGQKLLNGDLSGDNSLSLNGLLGGDRDVSEGAQLSIDGLSTADLFEGQGLSISTPQSAQQAVDIIGGALNKAIGARASVGAFQQSANFAAANIDSVIANQEAARSFLQDTDFAETSTLYALLNNQRNFGLAVAAQGNKISPAILKLVS